MNIQKISVDQKGFAELLAQSTAYMDALYPPESNQLLSTEELANDNVHIVGAFSEEALVAIGAVKNMCEDEIYGEIKRVFVEPSYRGQGVGALIMMALEQYLHENNVYIARLETGIYQPESLALYRKLGYKECAIFGTHNENPHSIFMEKTLNVL